MQIEGTGCLDSGGQRPTFDLLGSNAGSEAASKALAGRGPAPGLAPGAGQEEDWVRFGGCCWVSPNLKCLVIF